MNDFYNLFQSMNFSIFVARYSDVDPTWHSGVPEFRYVRIYYICEGEAEITLTTGRQILRAGYLYFIPSFQILAGDCADHMGHYFIHLIPDVFTEHFFTLLAFEKEIPLAREEADFLFRKVIDHYKEDSTYSRIITNNSIHLILSYFFRSSARNACDGEGHDLSRFVKVFDYIDKHISESIQLSELAGLTYMNKAYFSHLFKKTFGISPQQYIQKKKMDRARMLLADHTLSITEVASDLHFYDSAAFATFFKKYTGMTPKEFRASLFEGEK